MADYQLNANANDEIEIVKKAGSDYVRTLITKGEALARIATASKVEKSDKFKGLEICLDDGEMFVAGTFCNAKAEPKSEPEEKPAEPKKRGGRPKKPE